MLALNPAVRGPPSRQFHHPFQWRGGATEQLAQVRSAVSPSEPPTISARARAGGLAVWSLCVMLTAHLGCLLCERSR